MITLDEAVELLKAASKYDNRKPSENLRDSWHEAGTRAKWTFDEALDAIHAHYGDRTEWIMPGHVTALILASRHQARPPGAPSARPLREVLDDERTGTNPPDVASDEATRAAFVADIRRALVGRRSLDAAIDDAQPDPTDDGDACLDEACPWCHAPIGTRCTVRGRPMRRRSCHPARKSAKIERVSGAR